MPGQTIGDQDLLSSRQTSSSSMKYLFARPNRLSIVVDGFFARDSKNGVPRQMFH